MTLFEHADNPIPEGAVSGFITTPDGAKLRYARWPAIGSGAKGTVCLFHGRAEFIEKYFETVRDLTARGFAVATLDWRGQGGSSRLARDPRRGHVNDFRQYDFDLETFVTEVVLAECPPPYFAIGHSTGGNILLRNAVAMRTRFRRYVLIAPLLGLGPYGLPEPLIRLLAASLRLVGLSRFYIFGGGAKSVHTLPFQGNLLTSDARRYARNARLAEDIPEIAIGSPTIGWLAAAIRSMDRLTDPDFVDSIEIPTLMFGCGGDRVVSFEAIEQLATVMKVGTLITLPGARHELLQEQDVHREQFWAGFDAFVPGS